MLSVEITIIQAFYLVVCEITSLLTVPTTDYRLKEEKQPPAHGGSDISEDSATTMVVSGEKDFEEVQIHRLGGGGGGGIQTRRALPH